MRKTIWFAGGIAMSILYVLLVGYLTLQVIGLAAGAVLGLDNQLTAVTTPGPGLLQLGGIAAASAGVLLGLTWATRRADPANRFSLRLGFAVATTAQVVAAFAVLSQRFEVLNLDTGPAPWVEGWLTRGGTASVVHLMLIVAVGLLFTRREPTGVKPTSVKPPSIARPAKHEPAEERRP
ncbi:hypothetical protein [Pseudoclavibacter terrae]|uniref:DUF3995 domain-containing protein n=1 Tax=Pseudoclavibacter terrae TaxID=1530195 RepID=A0A7J5B124_9MICO|nr:hypothetical protein [Pseudoclavibacter terrae]KAB1637624.1 hypothetical protein F8O03_10420 [Pseudoclavibacter terrae]